MAPRTILQVPQESASATSRFRRYSPEREEIPRLQQISKGSGIATALEERYKTAFDYVDAFHLDNYQRALESIKGLEITPKDVFRFSISLGSMLDGPMSVVKAGLFLSALINSSAYRRFTIFTQHFPEPPVFLGYQNCKSVIVKGNVGFECAREMLAGRFVVEGDAEYSLGCLMSGGVVTIQGAAGRNLGERMTGGEIHLLGGYGYISCDAQQPCGGRIYIGKRKVVDGLWGAEDVRNG